MAICIAQQLASFSPRLSCDTDKVPLLTAHGLFYNFTHLQFCIKPCCDLCFGPAILILAVLFCIQLCSLVQIFVMLFKNTIAGLTAIGSVMAQQDVVQLSTGAIRGQTCSSSPATSFLGIPYAQPPTGELRFMPPQPLSLNASQIGGIFDATQVAAPCVQWGSEFDVDDPTPSEDW